MAKTPSEHGRRVGGRRAQVAKARFTEQLVALVLPDRRERVVALARDHGISQAAVLREVINLGLPQLEKRLAEGRIEPATLA
jgi:hypothetical protein